MPIIKYVINTFDIVAVLFFSMEYALKLVLCPIDPIDLLAIAPFYLSGVLAGLEGLEIISTFLDLSETYPQFTTRDTDSVEILLPLILEVLKP